MLCYVSSRNPIFKYLNRRLVSEFFAPFMILFLMANQRYQRKVCVQLYNVVCTVHVYLVTVYRLVQHQALIYSQASNCVVLDQLQDNNLYLAVDFIKITKVAIQAGILKSFTQAINNFCLNYIFVLANTNMASVRNRRSNYLHLRFYHFCYKKCSSSL